MVQADLCRPLICASARDCPSSASDPTTCENGLCAHPMMPWDSDDAVSFCVRAVPRLADCSMQSSYLNDIATALGSTLTANCDSSGTCTPPFACGM
jgi:hypothetical protein